MKDEHVGPQKCREDERLLSDGEGLQEGQQDERRGRKVK